MRVKRPSGAHQLVGEPDGRGAGEREVVRDLFRIGTGFLAPGQRSSERIARA
jgi:hypothetical protein